MKETRIIQIIISATAAVTLLLIAFGNSILWVYEMAIYYPYINVFIRSDHGGFGRRFVIFVWALAIIMLLSVVFTWINKKLFSLLTTAMCAGIGIYQIIVLIRSIVLSYQIQLNDFLFLLFPIVIAVLSIILVENAISHEKYIRNEKKYAVYEALYQEGKITEDELKDKRKEIFGW
jgi:hypothetical protein